MTHDEMTHDGFASRVRRDYLLELAIASGQALVLTQVFCPRRDDECLKIHVGLFEISRLHSVAWWASA